MNKYTNNPINLGNTVLIAATYKRPDVCNRLILSVGPTMKMIIVALSDSRQIMKRPGVHVFETSQMPLANALNLGARLANKTFPDTKAYLLTDDDVVFAPQTLFPAELFALLETPDTGLVAITRIINNCTPRPRHIEKPFVYKGGGYLIRREVFELIGGYTPNNSIDEWDICMKSYIAGYRNYRTQMSYAFHKQGSAAGGYRQAVKEGRNIGSADNWLSEWVTGEIVNVAGYDYLDAKSRPNAKAIEEHNLRNKGVIFASKLSKV